MSGTKTAARLPAFVHATQAPDSKCMLHGEPDAVGRAGVTCSCVAGTVESSFELDGISERQYQSAADDNAISHEAVEMEPQEQSINTVDAEHAASWHGDAASYPGFEAPHEDMSSQEKDVEAFAGHDVMPAYVQQAGSDSAAAADSGQAILQPEALEAYMQPASWEDTHLPEQQSQLAEQLQSHKQQGKLHELLMPAQSGDFHILALQTLLAALPTTRVSLSPGQMACLRLLGCCFPFHRLHGCRAVLAA